MTHREWDITDIAGSEVERPRLAGGGKHTHASLAFDPILPFVSVGVPVKLAHCARFNLNQRRGNLGGSREYAGIRNAYRPTFGLDRLLRHQTVAVAMRYGCGSGSPVGRQWSRNRSGKNITVFWVGRMAEQRGGNAKVLSQHLIRYVLKPVTDQEGIVFVEVAVIKDQEKLGTVRIKALDRMRNARREKPPITHTDIINKSSSLRVDRGDARLSVEHVSPLRGLVPMQFTYSTGVQTHVHAGDILRDAELTGGHLTGPAARLQSHMRVGKREAKIGQSAMVGGRRHQDIWVLAVSRNVSRAGIRAAMAGTLGLRCLFACLRARSRRCGQHATGGSRRQHPAT